MPAHGALGATFLIARIIQTCSLIAIIGLTANFIAEIVRYDAKPPGIFIGTITVVCPLIRCFGPAKCECSLKC